MTDIEPRRVVRPAQYGEVGSIARYADQPEQDYIDACVMAAQQPTVAIIVREFDLLDPGSAQHSMPVVEERNTAITRHAEQEVATQRRLITKLDQAGDALAPHASSEPAEDAGGGMVTYGLERFQVSTASKPQGKPLVRTVVVFYPGGRPKRTRRSAGSSEAGADQDGGSDVAGD